MLIEILLRIYLLEFYTRDNIKPLYLEPFNNIITITKELYNYSNPIIPVANISKVTIRRNTRRRSNTRRSNNGSSNTGISNTG